MNTEGVNKDAPKAKLAIILVLVTLLDYSFMSRIIRLVSFMESSNIHIYYLYSKDLLTNKYLL